MTGVLRSWPLAAPAAVVGVLWVLQLLVRIRRARGPRVSGRPASGDRETLTPAVVGLITANGVLPSSAAAATLLDLADRRYVDVEEVGPGLSLVRLRRDGEPERPYERKVLTHVRDLAAGGVVATEALAEGNTRLTSWPAEFDAAVVAEARSLGLTRGAPGLGTGISFTGLVAAALAGLYADLMVMPRLGGEPEGALVPPVIIAGIVAMASFDRWLGGERLTRAGRRAAADWLGIRRQLAGIANLADLPAAAVTVWGRQFGYAVAMGLNPAQVSLPIVRPRRDDAVWSAHGGLWHQVRIRYPGQSRLLAGVLLVFVFGGWLAITFGVTIWYALRPQGPGDLASIWMAMVMIPAGGFAVAAALACVLLPLGRLTRWHWRRQAERARPAIVVEGTVLRIQPAFGSGDYHYVAVDQGRRRIDALRLVGPDANGLQEGRRVRLRADRNGFVSAR